MADTVVVAERRKSSRRRLRKTSLQAMKHHPAKIRMASETGDVDVKALAVQGKLSKAAKMAVRRQRAEGIPITYKRGKRIIKEFPDGRKETLGEVKTHVFRVPKHVQVIGK